MMKILRALGGLLLILLATACGGGGGSAGTVPGTQPPSAGDTATSKVTDFALFTGKSTLLNSGTDTASITVVAVDALRNIVAGAAVTVSTDQNSVFTPNSAGAATDASGSYSGTIGMGSDKSDRAINVKVTINGIVKSAVVQVKGSKLTLQAAPNNPSPGQTVGLSVVLTDAADNPLANVPIKIGGTVPGLALTKNTDSNGRLTASFAAPTAFGVYQISATGNGVTSADYQLQVFTTVVPPAVIPAGVQPSLSANPNVVPVNSPGTSSSRSVVRFLMLDSQNKPVPNVRVRFRDDTTGVPTVGASLQNSGLTLYTDSSGAVSTQYISGQNPSPTNGVTVRACYSANDFATATDCPNSVVTTLTVAGQALSVSIGDDNLLEKGNGTYIRRFAISVADSAGKPVANAPVDLAVDLTHYGKAAHWVNPGATFPHVPLGAIGLTQSVSVAFVQSSQTFTFSWCANEDQNRNGFVDPAENVNGTFDTNGQPTLEPRKSDLLISYNDPLRTSTDANGLLSIKVEYSQRFATWLAYRVRVIANVQGSQGIAERLFVTEFVEGDDINGSFLIPPYGSNSSCSAPN